MLTNLDFFLQCRSFSSLLLTKPGSQILCIGRAQDGSLPDLSDSCLSQEALTPVETGLTGMAASPVSNQAARTLLPLQHGRGQSWLGHPVCACLDTAPAPWEGSMFILSQGACRAIGVGANPLFLVFLPALYLQGAHLHPSLLLLGCGRLQVLHQSLHSASSQDLRDGVPEPQGRCVPAEPQGWYVPKPQGWCPRASGMVSQSLRGGVSPSLRDSVSLPSRCPRGLIWLL